MGQYRKKPVVVEAWQWTPPAWIDMPKWLLDAIESSTCCCHQHGEAADMVVTINTLEGMMTAQPGDWIIKGITGEIYPCRPGNAQLRGELQRVSMAGLTPSMVVGK